MSITKLLLGAWLVMIMMTSIYAAEEKEENPSCDKAKPCWICDSSLREKGRLWCKEHNRYEDRCWLCHPELQDKKRLFCGEHGVYENECSLCHPELIKTKNSDDKKSAQAVKKEEDVKKCAKHNIDESVCFICTPAARQKGRLWCKEHNRYEDRCWLCHPELEDKDKEFCKEHSLYEDECTICNPPKKDDGLKSEQQDGSGDKRGNLHTPKLQCNEHGVFEIECAICHPELAETLASGDNLKIRFTSKLSASLVGIETKMPSDFKATDHVKTYAELSYDQNALAHVTPVTTGIIQNVLVDVGDIVKKGDKLLHISSTDVANAQHHLIMSNLKYQLALQEHQRQQELNKDHIAAKREVETASIELEQARIGQLTARQSLRNLTFDDVDIDRIASNTITDGILTIKAPFDGTIIERDAVRGASVDITQTIFKITDLDHMRINFSISEEYLNFIAIGQTINASFTALPDTIVSGKIIWISSSVDKRSRLINGRAVVNNPERNLKSGFYGKATIDTAAESTGLGIEQTAIQRIGQRPYVFVRDEDDLYSLRRVELGPRSGDKQFIRSGLSSSDNVVVKNSYIVYSEMMKSKLGAGCVDD